LARPPLSSAASQAVAALGSGRQWANGRCEWRLFLQEEEEELAGWLQ